MLIYTPGMIFGRSSAAKASVTKVLGDGERLESWPMRIRPQFA
ncbi:MAG: hypothetical protein V3V08_14825 [Nannocystaceae bacterium]